jgi:predicted outer membrane repeat protein
MKRTIRLRAPIAALIAVFASLDVASRAQAAGVVGTGTAASCTEAALDAALSGGGVVTFNCGPGMVHITVTATKAIAADTTIDGGGVVTLNGGNLVGVLMVNSGDLTVENLTIANGKEQSGGAGINNLGGPLTVTHCTFSGNSSSGANAGPGGAIANESEVPALLTVSDSTFSGNSGGSGGAIGSIGPVTVTGSTFTGNLAVDGGAIYALEGTLTVANSTFSGNSAGDTHVGGGIVAIRGLATIINSTFVGNSAGGGGAISGGQSITIINSIVANSPSGGNCCGAVTDGGHNLQFPGTSCGATVTSADPLLDPAGLADNGGPTETIALQPGSPAIETGDDAVCAESPVNGVDQRGFARPGMDQTHCSIGAFEYGGVAPACVGDCGGTGMVTIADLILGVNIALGNTQPSACEAFQDSQGQVTITQLIKGVNNALDGCGG